jgi:hypothetical protein
MTAEFPGNSKMPRPNTPTVEQEKKVESVVTNNVEKRKKSLGRRFLDIFIGGDSKSVVQYVFMDVLVPQAKEMITEAASQGFERLIYGESRPSRGPRRHGGTGYPQGPTNYTRYAVRGNNPIGRSAGSEDRRPLSQPRGSTIDDILLATRVEAETVLDRLYDLLKEYETASVADLHSLVGLSSSYTDQKWGWVDLHGSQIRRVRDGYILDLPKVVALD